MKFRRAQWIWSADPGVEQNQWRWFRSEFAIDDLSRAMELTITAETRYRVWLNGVHIGDGPHAGVPWRQLVDVHDLGPYLRQVGPQCLAVLVNSTGRHPHATRAGLIAEVCGDEEPLLATDTTWRVRTATAFASRTPAAPNNRARPFVVVEDRRQTPTGWQQPGFDDATWAKADLVERSSPESPQPYPWTRLVHEPLGISGHVFQPVRRERVEECVDLSGRNSLDHLLVGLSQVGAPLTHAAVDAGRGSDHVVETVMRCSTATLDGVFDPCLTLDFGTIRCARLRLEVTGSPGTTMDIGFAERLIDGHFSNAVEGPFAERIILEGGRHTFTSWHWQSFQYVRIRVRNCPDGLTVHQVIAQDATVDHLDRGSFAGAEDLQAIESICRSTLRLGSVDGIVDTPWREAGQWLGDAAAVITGGLRTCFADTTVTNAFFRRAAACQLPSGLLAGVSNSPEMLPGQGFADFSVWWVIGLWRHYQWSGDEALVQDHYGHVLRVMEAFSVSDNDDLLPETYPVFIDWSPIRRTGQLSFLTALFIEALRVLGEMSTMIGDSRRAADASADRQRLLTAFEERFVDPCTGVVQDNPVIAGRHSTVSEVANAAALMFAGLSDEASQRIVQTIWITREVDVVEAQPFGTALVLEALAAQGETTLALKIIRDRWGERMVDRGATTTFEEWSRNGSWRDGHHRGFLRSSSHAWAAYPAEFLIRVLPGLEVVEAGCATIKVSPRDHAENFESVWPTPHGFVVVRHRDGHTVVDAPARVRVNAEEGITVRHRD